MVASSPGSTQVHLDDVAESYDRVFTYTVIGRAERNAVWRELTQIFHAGQHILKLNCGT